MKYCKSLFNIFVCFSIFINTSYANRTAVGRSYFRISIETQKLCEIAFKQKSNPAPELLSYIQEKLKESGRNCKKGKCINFLDQKSKRKVNYLLEDISRLDSIEQCIADIDNESSVHKDHGTVFLKPKFAVFNISSFIQRQESIIPYRSENKGSCPAIAPGLTEKSFDLSQGQTCNSFLQSQLASQTSSSNIGDVTDIASLFMLSEDEILTHSQDQRFCESCLQDKFAVARLLNPGQDVTNNLDSEILKEKLDKKTQEKTKQLAAHLAQKRATQQVFKLSNIIQQVEHFKYRYEFDDVKELTCLDFKRIEKDIIGKCRTKDQSLVKERIRNVFSNVNGHKILSKGLGLSAALENLSKEVRESKVKCDNGSKITREHFLAQTYESFETDGRSSLTTGILNSLFASDNIFKNENFKILRSQNPNEPLSMSISRYILENLKMDSQNAQADIKSLFGPETELSESAVKIIKDIGLNFPVDGTDFNPELERKFLYIVTAVMEQVSNIDPILNIALNNQQAFESMVNEYQRASSRTRKPLSQFLAYGQSEKGSPKVKKEMQERAIILLKSQCNNVKENFISAICDQDDHLEKYSANELKDAIKEVRALNNDTQIDSTIAQGRLMCKQSNVQRPDELISKHPSLESPYSQSDITLEAFSQGDSEKTSAGFFNAFAKSTQRACNPKLALLDIASFRCQFRGQCDQITQITRSDDFSEVVSASDKSNVDSKTLRVSRSVKRAIKAIESGESFSKAEKIIAKNERENDSPIYNPRSNEKSSEQTIAEQVESQERSEVAPIIDEIEDTIEEQQVKTSEQVDVSNISETPYIPIDDSVQNSTSKSVMRNPASVQKRNALTVDKERASLIDKLSEDFTPGELEKMNLEQLRQLASTKDQSQSLGAKELQDKKDKLKREIAKLKEQKESQSEIQKLEEEKRRLQKEKEQIDKRKQKIGIAPRPTSSVSSAVATSTPSSVSQNGAQSVSNASSTESIDTTSGPESAFRSRGRIYSSIPSDISKVEQAILGESIGQYLRSAEVQDLLTDEKYVKFEKRQGKVIAIYVQSGTGDLIRIPFEKLDEKTKVIVNRYQKLSDTDIPAKEKSVLARLMQIERDISKRQKVQARRTTTLKSLEDQLAIFDRQIKKP